VVWTVILQVAGFGSAGVLYVRVHAELVAGVVIVPPAVPVLIVKLGAVPAIFIVCPSPFVEIGRAHV
jgi:hypothetical protein